MAAFSTLKVSAGLDLSGATKELLRREVLVGIPGEAPARPPELGDKTPPSNALIGYVQEFGDEERGIPPRPFLVPGVAAAKDPIAAGLRQAATSAMEGNRAGIDSGLEDAGLAAQVSVRKTILAGDFTPLAESTLKARARRRTEKGGLSQAETSKAARRELTARASGEIASTDARPLYDTHSMFNAITYVLSDRKRNGT